MKKCDCYCKSERFEYNPIIMKGVINPYSYCNGTKERDECSCGGDRTKCDFYPEVREKAKAGIGEDKFIVTYDCCSSDIPTLVVASDKYFDITIMNKFQGDEATTIYHLLRGDNNLTEILRKPIGDLNSVPHYRCPTCNSAVAMYCDDPKYPCCQWCGQKLDWNDNKSHETKRRSFAR